jgi:hypothetical protein
MAWDKPYLVQNLIVKEVERTQSLKYINVKQYMVQNSIENGVDNSNV